MEKVAKNKRCVATLLTMMSWIMSWMSWKYLEIHDITMLGFGCKIRQMEVWPSFSILAINPLTVKLRKIVLEEHFISLN